MEIIAVGYVKNGYRPYNVYANMQVESASRTRGVYKKSVVLQMQLAYVKTMQHLSKAGHDAGGCIYVCKSWIETC